MVGKIFSVFTVFSVIAAVYSGSAEGLCRGIIDGAERSVNISLSLMGMMMLWSGIMNVFKESGIIGLLARILRPVLAKIFPSSFKDNVATEEITACISANLLGISNAATPLALSAMKRLDEQNSSLAASDDMITLTIMGCACFNLVPTTLLALRNTHSAQINYEIIVPIWICSGTCMILGIILSRLASKIIRKYG